MSEIREVEVTEVFVVKDEETKQYVRTFFG